MSIPIIIAIDGPAASGKSTVGKMLAEGLGYLCLDTGVMYRAVTLAALMSGISICDENSTTRLAEKIQIDIRSATVQDGRDYDVLLDGKDVTWEIRLPEVNKFVSPVSAYRGVRKAMTKQQRRIGSAGKIVMLGRDIGSVVLPDADLKIYLDASVEERTNRRYKEEIARGNKVCIDEVAESIKHRDLIDSTRSFAPLKVADDAIVIKTDNLTVEEVVQKIKELMKHV